MCPICSDKLIIDERYNFYKYNYYCKNNHFQIQEPPVAIGETIFNIKLDNTIIAISDEYHSYYYENYILNPTLMQIKPTAYSHASNISQKSMEHMFKKCKTVHDLIYKLNKMVILA